MAHRVTLIEGDGIGPEIIAATVEIIDALNLNIVWDKQLAGAQAIREFGTAVPEHTLNSIRHNRVALKGPTTTPIGEGHKSANVILRQKLDLFASVRPVRSILGVPTRYEDVDLVIFRENTEGLYGGHELEIAPGCVISLKVSTEKACLRIAQEAFSYAEKMGRKKVSVAHKANILKKGDGLMLQCTQSVAKNFPQIAYEEVIIDALCMRLVSNPDQFDVLLMENLYGDIISDLCAGLVGGLGLVPGANLGQGVGVFEAVHGSAPDIAGKGIANPTAMIQSAIMMLKFLNLGKGAKALKKSLLNVFAQEKVRTPDLGGRASTQEFTNAIIAAL